MSDYFACELGVVVLGHCILDTSQNHASKGVGNSHTKFGVFVSNMCADFFSDLDVVACKTCYRDIQHIIWRHTE